ncbi:MAG: hypothetical protein WA741_22905 [Candidatus Sulfotelmatobacter sp.]
MLLKILVALTIVAFGNPQTTPVVDVELQIKKARTNGERAKLSAFQKPCDKMAEAIVTDGGKRGSPFGEPRAHHGRATLF